MAPSLAASKHGVHSKSISVCPSAQVGCSFVYVGASSKTLSQRTQASPTSACFDAHSHAQSKRSSCVSQSEFAGLGWHASQCVQLSRTAGIFKPGPHFAVQSSHTRVRLLSTKPSSHDNTQSILPSCVHRCLESSAPHSAHVSSAVALHLVTSRRPAHPEHCWHAASRAWLPARRYWPTVHVGVECGVHC